MKKKRKKNRKCWFRGLTTFLKIFIRKPKYVHLGEGFVDKSIVLSNHVGSAGPLTHELYFPKNFRFWGTYEMNSGLKSVYIYLSQIYFYQKKHKSKATSKFLGFIVAPFANLFYKGLNLISTYRDYRLRKTLSTSIETLNKNETLIIFPEDSSDGYHDELKECFAGFVVLGKLCLKNNIDVPVYASYFRKKEKVVVVDKPVILSELLNSDLDKKEIARRMRDRMNELGNMDISEYIKNKRK